MVHFRIGWATRVGLVVALFPRVYHERACFAARVAAFALLEEGSSVFASGAAFALNRVDSEPFGVT